MSNEDSENMLRRRFHDALDPALPAAGVEGRVLQRLRPRLVRSTPAPNARWQQLRTTLGGALAALVVILVIGGSLGVALALRSHTHPTTVPKPSPPTTPATPPIKPSSPPWTPPATAQVSSTITATTPLLVTWDPTSEVGSAPSRYIARDYQGRVVGTFTLDQNSQAAGVSIAPDGSKLLIGGRLLYDIYGHRLADIYADDLPEPIWADDSSHLCGFIATANDSSTGVLVEVSASGEVRTVARLGQRGWGIIACSPDADRAVVSDSTGPTVQEINWVVLRLSTGQVIATYPGWSASGAVSTHDGRLLAVDEANGISIRDMATGRQLAWVVRWGSQAGYPLIGAAVVFSWDGKRLLIDGGGAGGATHPRWLVAWATNTNVMTNVTAGSTELESVVPLTSGPTFLVEEPVSPYRAYLLEGDGVLHLLP